MKVVSIRVSDYSNPDDTTHVEAKFDIESLRVLSDMGEALKDAVLTMEKQIEIATGSGS